MLQKAYGWNPGGLWGTDPLYEGGGVRFDFLSFQATPCTKIAESQT